MRSNRTSVSWTVWTNKHGKQARARYTEFSTMYRKVIERSISMKYSKLAQHMELFPKKGDTIPDSTLYGS